MPIQHTVVFRLRHQPGSREEHAFLVDARTALTSIPGVDDFVVNREVSPKNAFAFQFSMVFADEDVYEAYNAHPAHVADRWVPEVEEFAESDFTAA